MSSFETIFICTLWSIRIAFLRCISLWMTKRHPLLTHHPDRSRCAHQSFCATGSRTVSRLHISAATMPMKTIQKEPISCPFGTYCLRFALIGAPGVSRAHFPPEYHAGKHLPASANLPVDPVTSDRYRYPRSGYAEEMCRHVRSGG